MADHPPLLYASSGLDRVSHLRRDENWLQAAQADPKTRILPMYGLKCLVDADDGTSLVMPSLDELGAWPAEAVLLGMFEGEAVFVADIPDLDNDDRTYVEIRSIAQNLPQPLTGLLAFARGIMHWTIRHRFCGSCGGATHAIDAGHARRCNACGLDTFPRTDPAVIVLVTDGAERCILGRSKRIPAGMYSTLAGFVEPGETIDQTVEREVFEEVGAKILSLRYRTSQPWPFPQSLMLGFHATADFGELVVDEHEMDDARWFTRTELLDEATRPVRLPTPDSIARFLIEEWLNQAR